MGNHHGVNNHPEGQSQLSEGLTHQENGPKSTRLHHKQEIKLYAFESEKWHRNCCLDWSAKEKDHPESRT